LENIVKGHYGRELGTNATYNLHKNETNNKLYINEFVQWLSE
jgi:hypothetical protein